MYYIQICRYIGRFYDCMLYSNNIISLKLKGDSDIHHYDMYVHSNYLLIENLFRGLFETLKSSRNPSVAASGLRSLTNLFDDMNASRLSAIKFALNPSTVMRTSLLGTVSGITRALPTAVS